MREPLAGQRARCPVAPHTAVALSSAPRSIAGLRGAAQTRAATWGPPTAVTLPALSVTVGEMVQALGRVAGPATTSLIDWEPDARIAAIVSGWPHRIRAARAQALGLQPETSFETLVRDHLREHLRDHLPDHPRAPLRAPPGEPPPR